MKRFFSLVTFFVIVGFFLMKIISADGEAFSSPYFGEIKQSQKIYFEHQELLNYAEPWQIDYLIKIDGESQKVLKEFNDLKKIIKSDPEKNNGEIWVILGVIDSEIELALTHELRLNLESQEFEFKTALAYWRSLQAHPDSPLRELKDYLSR